MDLGPLCAAMVHQEIYTHVLAVQFTVFFFSVLSLQWNHMEGIPPPIKRAVCEVTYYTGLNYLMTALLCGLRTRCKGVGIKDHFQCGGCTTTEGKKTHQVSLSRVSPVHLNHQCRPQ